MAAELTHADVSFHQEGAVYQRAAGRRRGGAERGVGVAQRCSRVVVASFGMGGISFQIRRSSRVVGVARKT